MHPEDKKIVSFWIKKLFDDKKLIIIKDVVDKPLKQRFFIGFKGRVKLILDFPELTPLQNKEFTQKLCQKLDCDFAVEGGFLSHYSYKGEGNITRDFISHTTVGFIKNGQFFELKKDTPKETKISIIKNIEHEILYWGHIKEVVFSKEIQLQEKSRIGSFFQVNGVSFKFSNELLEEKKLQFLQKYSSAYCVYSSLKNTLTICQDNKDITLSNDLALPLQTKLIYSSGEANLQLQDSIFRKELLTSIVRDSNSFVIHDSVYTKMQYKDPGQAYVNFLQKQYSKYEWGNYHPSIIITYFKDDIEIAKTKYNNLEKNNQDKLHELIVESIRPDYFKVFEWKPDNQILYIGRYQPDFNEAFQQSLERKIKKQNNLEVALHFESKRMELDSDTSISSAGRSDSEAFSFQNVHAKWWSEKRKWGLKGYFYTYDYRYSVTSLSTNSSTITTGQMSEWSLMYSRHYQKNFSFADRIELSAGYTRKNFKVPSNKSIGDIYLISIPLELSAMKKYKKVILNYDVALARIYNAQARFDLGSTGGDGDGFWYEFKTKASYPLFKNIFFSLGANFRQGIINYPGGDSQLSETGVFIGFEYLHLDF